MELEPSLKIMSALENGATIQEAKNIFESQGHTELSATNVRTILFHFSSKGPEFWEETSNEEISPEGRQILAEKTQENIKLAQINANKTNAIEKKYVKMSS